MTRLLAIVIVPLYALPAAAALADADVASRLALWATALGRDADAGRYALVTSGELTSMAIRIVWADAHPVFRAGLRSLLAGHADFEVVGEAADGVEALRVASTLMPDVLLVDQLMPGMTGTEVLRDLSSRGFCVRTIVLTADITRADIVLALRAGARGIVLKDVATELLLKSIRAVHGGQVWVGREVVSDVMRLLSAPSQAADAEERFGPRFTAREREVVRLVVECETNRRIAARMGIGEDTVKHHLTSIFDKSGASSRMELARFALHHQWIQSEASPP